MKLNKILLYWLGIVFTFLFSSCDTPNNTSDRIPSVYVNYQVNLLDPNQAVPNNGGYRYISGVGYKGILLYKDNTGNYFAFERSCSNQPTNTCEIVEMDASLLFFKCKCCSSIFDFKGAVTGGVAIWPLNRYSTTVNGNILQISN